MRDIILDKSSLIYDVLVNFIIVKLPTFLLLPVLEIIHHFYKMKFIKNKINKRLGTLELIESIVLTYDKIVNKRNNSSLNLLNFHEKFNKTVNRSLIKDNLHLYLLRNLLYRILNKCLTQDKIRKLVKMEILKAPERTFSDFIDLFNDLRGELNTIN